MQQMYQCPRCGAQVPFGTRFCTNCGTPLNWPGQQQMQPPPVYQQWQYGREGERPKQKKTSPSLIGCLGLIAMVFLIGGAIFALQEPSPTAPTLPEYIHQYENKQPPYNGASGERIHLVNNPNATNPTYAELVAFIKEDSIDEGAYVSFGSNSSFASLSQTCGDFAEAVHNNAEEAGIRAAWVGIQFEGEGEGHALNAFETIDKGLVYIDCTGQNLGSWLVEHKVKINKTTKEISFEEESLTSWDKIAYVEVGKEYGVIDIDKAKSLSYSFYIEYVSNWQKLDNMIDDFKNEVDAFNQALGGRTRLAEPEYSKFKAWEVELREKERILYELADEIGDSRFEPLGIVETVKIYW